MITYFDYFLVLSTALTIHIKIRLLLNVTLEIPRAASNFYEIICPINNLFTRTRVKLTLHLIIFITLEKFTGLKK